MWLDSHISLSYLFDSYLITGNEQISTMLSVNLAVWFLNLEVLAYQLSALLVYGTLKGASWILMTLPHPL